MLKPSGSSAAAHPAREAAGGERRSLEVLVGDLDQVGAVGPRHDQRVARGRRVDVHEGDRVLVGVDDLRRHVAGDDPAEEAVARHPRGSLPGRTGVIGRGGSIKANSLLFFSTSFNANSN